MKIFWTIVIIVVIVLGYRMLTGDAPADQAVVEDQASAIESEATEETSPATSEAGTEDESASQ